MNPKEERRYLSDIDIKELRTIEDRNEARTYIIQTLDFIKRLIRRNKDNTYSLIQSTSEFYRYNMCKCTYLANNLDDDYDRADYLNKITEVDKALQEFEKQYPPVVYKRLRNTPRRKDMDDETTVLDGFETPKRETKAAAKLKAKALKLNQLSIKFNQV